MRSSWLIAGLVLWLGGAAAAMAGLTAYKGRAGERASAPASWPLESQLAHVDGRATALIFIHPRCPCSRATLTELRAALQGRAGRADVIALFLKPADSARDWADTDTWASAGELEGVRRVVDSGGAEARRFGSLTSGQVLFYDAHGNLQMSGGITAARGHEGDNAGRRELEALLDGQAAQALPETPVFGCPLHDGARQ